MSSEIAISVRNLGKCYHIYEKPADRLKHSLWRGRRKFHKDFWALKDVSFEVRRGETVGIIGRNGSGKSTLLQAICGTLAPTNGEVRVRGRVSALLELGAGFNPEFTGRENVFMNASVMGVAREEIEAKYESIAAFADIGDFIDRPVKTYSSGMYVRLAFAVAISVEPDILIIDEALSVGDEAFQRKCFARIHDIKKRGATVLFVSHSATSVIELCKTAILLDQGEMLLSGPPKQVVSAYQKLIYAPSERVDALRKRIAAWAASPAAAECSGASEEPSDGLQASFDPSLKPKSTLLYESRGAFIREPRVTTLLGKRVNVLVAGEEYCYSYEVRFDRSACGVRMGMMIKTVSGFELGGAGYPTVGGAIDFVEAGKTAVVRLRFRCSLTPGFYFLNAGLVGMVNGAETYLHRWMDAVMIRVMAPPNSIATGFADFQVAGEVDFSDGPPEAPSSDESFTEPINA